MHQTIVPGLAPLPLPGPTWLFSVLLLVTFLLHLLAMNCLVGGSVIALSGRVFGQPGDFRDRLSSELAKKIPSLLAATITLGVAPLLFVQVLYGQFFYTSSVLMAWPWFSVVILVTVGYYGAYVVALRGDGRAKFAWLAALSLLPLLAVAFVYTNNFTLMLAPTKWMSKYMRDRSGLSLNLDEPMLWPRLLHTLVGAIAVGGLLVVVLGLIRRTRDSEYSNFLVRQGAYWFMAATLAELATGMWFLLSLPGEKMMLFIGGSTAGTILLFAGVFFAAAAVFALLVALRMGQPPVLILSSIGSTLLVIVCMVLMRQVLRADYLSAYLELPRVPVRTQWDVLVLFLVLLVGAVGLWILC